MKNIAQSPWWVKTTIYQIYPRSFKDSNQDGIGDLKGIISKLDYIKDLGFETIWLSPFFTSPQRDGGYDISHFLEIAPEYGQMADVDQLIDQVHQKGMRVIFDLVLNHTSDQHPWFRESRSSKDNSKRDWYIWRDGRGKRPPNNWRSIVGGSGWHYDPPTGQWYYASFLPFQPDLNYRNPEVIKTMLGIAKYWLDKGVDGFRLDIFHTLFKDAQFRDNPCSTTLFSTDFQAGYFQNYVYNHNQPETIQFALQLRRLADSYLNPRLLLGEVFAKDVTLKKYLGTDMDGLNLVFLWNLIHGKADATHLREVLHHFETHYTLPYTPVLVFGNHDVQRLITRIGSDPKLAALLAVFQLTARGVPVVYYGDEIGMEEMNLSKKDWKDPVGQRFRWVPGMVFKALKLSATRDGCRTPMQWGPEVNAGFTIPGIHPWMPVNAHSSIVNVSSQADRPLSLLNTYRKLLKIRREHAALHLGRLELIEFDQANPQLLAYRRQAGDEILLVLINFGPARCTFGLENEHPHIIFQIGKVTLEGSKTLHLEPQSAAILAK
ncbi:MAG: alpha-glucosidase [Anaerolineales bacterium]